MQSNHIELVFIVHGDTIPRDHGYALYGAICRKLPNVHGADWLAIHGIPGKRLEANRLALEGESRLRLRIPIERIPDLLPLSGQTIDLSGTPLAIGPPLIHQLRPSPILDARLVVIRLTGGVPKPFDHARFETRFRDEIHRQLDAANIVANIELRGRSHLSVGRHRIIGYAVRASDLSSDHSLQLQIHGLGGKRIMGCGLFRPARWKQAMALESAA